MKPKFLKPQLFADWLEEDIQPIELKDLKKGETFYEGNICTENFELTVISNPKQRKEGWSCKVKNTKGRTIELYVADDTSYPKPDFYRMPHNMVMSEDGSYVYEVL